LTQTTQKYRVEGINTAIRDDCQIGEGTVIWHHCVLYGCRIGRNCRIGSHVTIGKGVVIGDNCKIEDFAFIPQGVTMGNRVFIGPHVCFTNDRFPYAQEKWHINETVVRDDVSIGANSTIMSGIILNKKARVGAGSIVTKGVPEGMLVYGESAKERRTVH